MPGETDRCFTLLAHLHMQRDVTGRAIEYVQPDADLPDRQVDIPKLKRGGVGCIWLSEGAPGEFMVDATHALRATEHPNTELIRRTIYHGASGVQRLLRGFDVVRRLCAASAELELVTTTRETRDAWTSEKIAVFLHTENLLMANDLAVLRAYYEVGLRVTGLVHGVPQDWIDCDAEQRMPGGLTAFGREVVDELNRLGILMDVSHASEQAIDDVLEQTTDPIVASHSNAQAVSPLRRNLTDAHMKRIANSGGVIGVHCSSAFVDIRCSRDRVLQGDVDDGLRETRLQLLEDIRHGIVDPFEAEAGLVGAALPFIEFPTASVDALVDVVDHMVDVAGEEHVGIGTDFQYLEDPVVGFSSAAEATGFLAALERRGYSSRAIARIAGENFLRAMADVID